MQGRRLVAAPAATLLLLVAALLAGGCAKAHPAPTDTAEVEETVPKCAEGCVCGKGTLDCAGVEPSVFELELLDLELKTALAETTDNEDEDDGDSGPFRGLSNVQRLVMNECALTAVRAQTFAPLVSLRELDLRNNELRAVPPRTFADCSQLHKLYLSGNPLAEAPALRQPELRWLELDDCRLEELPEDALSGMPDLLYLSLRNNSLRELPAAAVAQLSKLSHVHLETNVIEHLEPRIFHNHSLLQTLYLRRNRIQLPEDTAFLVSSTVLILDLSACGISSVSINSFSELPELRSLLLAENNIEVLPMDVFDKTQHLKVLDLRDNKIATLELKVFSVLRFKANALLDVTGNPLGCECYLLKCKLNPRRCFMVSAGLQWEVDGACTPEEAVACTGYERSEAMQQDPEKGNEDDFYSHFDEDQPPDITALLVPKDASDADGAAVALRPMHLAFGVSGAVLFVIVIFVTVWMARRCRRHHDDDEDYDDELGETTALSWTVYDPDEGKVRAGSAGERRSQDVTRPRAASELDPPAPEFPLAPVPAAVERPRTLSQPVSPGRTFRSTLPLEVTVAPDRRSAETFAPTAPIHRSSLSADVHGVPS